MKRTTTLFSVIQINKLVSILFFGGCMLWMGMANASTYLANGSGNFTDSEVWETEAPGNITTEWDSIIIKGNIKLDIDLVLNGVLIIYPEARIMGSKNIIVLENGYINNAGLTVLGGLTNRGTLNNVGVIETSGDFINTGRISNNASLIIGNIFDNSGYVTGNGGKLMASKSIVNSTTGTIMGLNDVCAKEFMNVEGGRIDSVSISYCGQRIFNSLYISARLKKGGIEINVLNSENIKFKNYQVQRSDDGEEYKDVANVSSAEITDFTVSFRYKDAEAPINGEVYYKVILTEPNGNLKELPAVKVAYL